MFSHAFFIPFCYFKLFDEFDLNFQMFSTCCPSMTFPDKDICLKNITPLHWTYLCACKALVENGC